MNKCNNLKLIKRKFYYFLSLYLVLLFFLIGCKKNNYQNQNKNQNQNLKIVCLGSGDCEILAKLNSTDQIVAVGENCNYPIELQAKPIVVSNFSINKELLFFYKPNIIIVDKMTQNQNVVDDLRKIGFNVVYTGANTFSEVYSKIETISLAINKLDDGKRLIDSMQNEIKMLQSQAKEASVNNQKYKIYFEISPLEYGLWTGGNNTFFNEISEFLNCENIFAKDFSGWAQVSQEQVIKSNPDYIITVSNIQNNPEFTVNEIKSRTGWDNISAVQNDKVIYIDSDVLSRPGPRLIDGMKLMYNCIYQN